MENNKICPACQRKNNAIATHCHYCGTSLSEPKFKYTVTTKGVQLTPPDHDSKVPGCQEIAQKLPERSLALLVIGAEEPIIIHNIQSIVLGRGDEAPPGVEFVNLAQLGDLVMGISRQHARIFYEDKKFWLEDMHSTNGSWLNRKRLVAGVPYALAPDDYIWLGPLKMAVCFASGKGLNSESKEAAKVTTIALQPRNAIILPSQPLSPSFLVQHVAPFLQGLADVQQAMDRWRGRTAVPVLIQSIQEKNLTVIVTLNGAAEITSLYHALISVWRDNHFTEFQASSMPETELNALLEELTSHIGQAVDQNLEDATREAWVQAALPGVKTLATSLLEISQISQPKETTTLGLDNLTPP